jgi:hypothetical protein
VSEHQRERFAGGDAVDSKANIGVANPAACYLDDDLVRSRLQRWQVAQFQRLACGGEPIRVSTLDAHD